jgi:hypothetical protein
MQIHLLAPSTIVFGAKKFLDRKIKIDAKYVCFLELHTTVIPVIFFVSVFPGIRYSPYRYFSVGITGVMAKFLPLWFG